MTKEQKIEWAATATNEQLLSQLGFAWTWIHSENIATQVDGHESLDILNKEILRRMEK